MAVPLKYMFHQGAVIKGMGGAALTGLKKRLSSQKQISAGTLELPGPLVVQRFAPRDSGLVKSYVRHVGGDPAAYRSHLPAHLFPQWALAMSGKLTADLDYPLLAAMNAGCRIVQNAPLPAGEELIISARLHSIDDNGRRAIITQRFTTSTPSVPDALVADLMVYIPLKAKKAQGEDGGQASSESKAGALAEGSEGKEAAERSRSRREPRTRVPHSARELATWKLGPKAGLDFSKLTGDFNPVHWVRPWARAFGFPNTILHGFATLARAMEGLNRNLLSGDVQALQEIEVRFTRPLVLPARVGLFVRGNRLWVGDAPGGPAYLEGRFRLKETAEEGGEPEGEESDPG